MHDTPRKTGPSLAIWLLATLALLSAPLSAERLELTRIMADPAWIGNPVEQAWWQLDGSGVVYRIRRADSELFDLRRIDLASGEDRLVEPAEQSMLAGSAPIFHALSGRAVYVREGNLFLDSLDGSAPRQLTRGPAIDRNPGFSPAGRYVRFQRAEQWWQVDLQTGLSWPVAELRFEADPDAEPEDGLSQHQLRLFSSLREDLAAQREQRAEQRAAAAADASRSPAPWFLGTDFEMVNSSLSPDGRWLLMAVRSSKHEPGRRASMPNYVTVDGYIDVEDVRSLVGRNPPAAQSLWLLDLERRERHELDLSGLPGIQDDPLAGFRQAEGLEPLAEGSNRALSIIGIAWHPEAALAAVMLRANDNKDRWIATLDPENPSLRPRHRLTDPAWINWAYNNFGWLGQSNRLWFLSEQSDFAHFYTIDAESGSEQAHTSGPFEIMDPVVSSDGRQVWLLSNRSHPTEYDLYRLDLDSNELVRLTEHRGIEDFAILPGHEQILVRYSEPYLPAQVGLVPAAGGDIQRLTDTRSEEFLARAWQAPQIVGIESSHGAGPIWSKFYPARTPAPEGGHPVVLFVHGAGYLQNVHWRYPQYFREQMFHNLLTERGYHVLDMDFRASQGYGRNWRTAIYRQMGTPELEDLVDGVNWLVEQHGANPARVGLYGGSYGGFLTFMALFKAPEVFAAGAALRPVSDWAHYNHGYTSNILNTPQLDPVAYARSSPIEFAEGLQGHLLMTHGMLDDNVFYQDVVRLAQRLIDLEKENWELASYPLEAHGFQRPSSWLDQYRRILRLFETTIGEAWQAP